MNEPNIQPIDMGGVWFELRGLVAVLEMISVGLSEDCAQIDDCEEYPKDSWRHICVVNNAKNVYSPALNHVHGQLHDLLARVDVSE